MSARSSTPTLWKSVVIGEEYFPGPNTSTDADILEQIQSDFNGLRHAFCTCRMGRPDDENAVVDSKARAIGAKNLRVVDAPSFALLPPGHPMAAVSKDPLHCYLYSTAFGSIADKTLNQTCSPRKLPKTSSRAASIVRLSCYSLVL